MGGCCDFCCIGDCCIFDFGGGGGCGYTPSHNSDDESAKKISNELAERKAEYEERAEKAEKEIVSEINGNMDHFIEEVKKINMETYGGRRLNINVEAIIMKKNNLSGQVVGQISNVMHDRLVMTDKELSVILEEKNDKKRGDSFKAFCDRLEKEAKNSIKVKIKETTAEQQKLVQTEIENRMHEIEVSMKNSIENYEKVLAVNEKDIVEQEKLQLELMYKHGLYDLIGKQLDL